MNRPSSWLRLLAYGFAGMVSLACLYPYFWMLVSAFRSTEAILSSPLRPWPEHISLDVLREISSVGGTPLWRFRPTDADVHAATVEGTVTEVGERTRLEGAVITIVDPEGRLIAEAVSDQDGRYRFDEVPPGSYVVSAYYTLVGRGQFEIRRNDVVLTAGEVVVVPLAIETEGP